MFRADSNAGERALPIRKPYRVRRAHAQFPAIAAPESTAMPVNLQAPDPQSLHAVRGVELGIAMAGVRKANRRDLTVVTIAPGSTVAGVFTRNRFCAAPVQLCRTHLAGSAS